MKTRKSHIGIVISIITFIIGVALLISGLFINVPDMGEPGWFEKSSSQGTLTMFGSFLMIVGVITTIVNLSAPRIKNISSNIIHKTTDIIENINDKMIKKRKKHKSITKTKCSYCGTKYHNSREKCPNCGAPNNK